MTTRSHSDAYDEAIRATAVNGEIVLIGPHAIAVSITADAAEESARNILEAVREARHRTSAEER
jgi:hypothetical protein